MADIGHVLWQDSLDFFLALVGYLDEEGAAVIGIAAATYPAIPFHIFDNNRHISRCSQHAINQILNPQFSFTI